MSQRGRNRTIEVSSCQKKIDEKKKRENSLEKKSENALVKVKNKLKKLNWIKKKWEFFDHEIEN